MNQAKSVIPTFDLVEGEGGCQGCVFTKRVEIRGVSCRTTSDFEEPVELENSCRGLDGAAVYAEGLITDETEEQLSQALANLAERKTKTNHGR